MAKPHPIVYWDQRKGTAAPSWSATLERMKSDQERSVRIRRLQEAGVSQTEIASTFRYISPSGAIGFQQT
jgi:hypothetical protein